MKAKILKFLSRFRKSKPPSPLTEDEENLFHTLIARTRLSHVGEVLDHLEHDRFLRSRLIHTNDPSRAVTMRLWATNAAIRKVEDAIYELFQAVEKEPGVKP